MIIVIIVFIIETVAIITLGFLLNKSINKSLVLELEIIEVREVCKDLIGDLAISKEGVITWKKNIKEGVDLDKENKILKEENVDLKERLDRSNKFERSDILDLEE